MIKVCPECGGIGYIEFPDYDYEENILEYGIRFCCDLCQGVGHYEVKSMKLAISVYTKPLKRFLLDIQNTINRPNNPEIWEIIETYVKYHYGDVEYDYIELDETVEIDEDWNISNYR